MFRPVQQLLQQDGRTRVGQPAAHRRSFDRQHVPQWMVRVRRRCGRHPAGVTWPPRFAGRLAAMLTLGVEEEFFLLGPDGAVAPVAADVVRAGGGAIVPEYMAYQVETASGVCTRLDELRADLWRRRAHAATMAARAGAWLISSGSVPFPNGPVSAVGDDARYRTLARRFPYATLGGGSCACHVHVGIADRTLAVDVLGR